MSSPSKVKGYLWESWLKKDLQAEGFSVERAGQAYQPDLILDGFGKIEAKCKKNLKGIHDILGDNHACVVKWQSPQARGKPAIAFIPYDLFKLLLHSYIDDKTRTKDSDLG